MRSESEKDIGGATTARGTSCFEVSVKGKEARCHQCEQSQPPLPLHPSPPTPPLFPTQKEGEQTELAPAFVIDTPILGIFQHAIRQPHAFEAQYGSFPRLKLLHLALIRLLLCPQITQLLHLRVRRLLFLLQPHALPQFQAPHGAHFGRQETSTSSKSSAHRS
eukprot:991003-Rhodomonas_salina.2